MVTRLYPFYRRLRDSSLISNTGIYAVGNLMRKAVGFLLIPIYTRVLTPEDYGIVGLTLAVGGLLGILLGLGVRPAVARLYFDYRNDRRQLGAYITTNFFSSQLSLADWLFSWRFLASHCGTG